MKLRGITLTSLLLAAAAGTAMLADTNPTTWSASDELHRTLPLSTQEGIRPYDEGVDVGMF